MELTLDELKTILSALGTLDAEYGSQDAVFLADRVRETIERREAEIKRYA